MPTKNNSERKLFEVEFGKLNGVDPNLLRVMRQGENYVDQALTLCWKVWQVARRTPATN